MSNSKVIILSFCIIITSALLGHYFAPASIFFTPVIIGIIVLLLTNTGIKIYYFVLLVIIALTLNDILIKLTAGGTHDFEGAGFINLFFIISVAIATIIAFSVLMYKHKGRRISVILYCLLIPIVSYFYLSYFDFLGLVNYQNTSKSKEIAIKNKVFLNDLKFSVNPIIYKDDTIKIINGWDEKQIIVNHEQLIKRYDDTSTINYTLKLKCDKKLDDLDIRYNTNDTDVSRSNSIDSVISFNCHRYSKVVIYFFKSSDTSKNDTLFNKLVISE